MYLLSCIYMYQLSVSDATNTTIQYLEAGELLHVHTVPGGQQARQYLLCQSRVDSGQLSRIPARDLKHHSCGELGSSVSAVHHE